MRSYKRSSGAYIFKPKMEKPVPIYDIIKADIFKSDIVHEMHIKYTDFAIVIVKLYQDVPVIEVEWIIGPVPIEDGIGKDVILRYTTDLINNNVFYTDSNGRQTIKRIRNRRASWKYEQIRPVVGNYYPVTARIFIEDKEKNIRFSVFNDRSQGGSSLADGEIELMIHRRLVSDEGNLYMILNETLKDDGIIVRGKHHLYISKSDINTNKIYEKKLIKQLQLPPQILVSKRDPDFNLTWFQKFTNEFTALQTKLPIGIHLLSLEPWSDKTLLLRLENYLEKSELGSSKTRKVNLEQLFVNIKVVNVKEMTLAANIWKDAFIPLQWRYDSKFMKSFNEFYGSDKEIDYVEDLRYGEETVHWTHGIQLSPMEIRTFIIEYDYMKII